MRIILSPAKKMNLTEEYEGQVSQPVFMAQTEEIMRFMKGLTYEEAKKLWACNDAIASENFERFARMDLYKRRVPAILSYEGIAYQYMAPHVLESGEFDYIKEHLRILSAFYGVLKPMDGVTPYRLEMQAKAKIAGTKNLYDYWKDLLYREVVDDSGLIINLASKEYSKCIEKYLTKKDRMITCVFAEWAKDKLVQKGVYAKMARGEMVRFMAVNHVEDPEEIKGFDALGFSYSLENSSPDSFVFIRRTEVRDDG